jgi:two-component system, chemotaxis family, CheB/CheR fusion protein
MVSRKKDKVKTPEAPDIRSDIRSDIRPVIKTEIDTDTDTEFAENVAEAQEMAEKPAVTFPIVGIGASAGGLAAFEAFFSGMPKDVEPGMAFVLVQHLAPDHKSILTDLIRRYTRMQVFEVEDGIVVQPNCAYIIPPNRDMAFINGVLQLMEPSAPRGQRMPIDFFFQSLAHDQHERAICIVLSGTGSDGTLGIRAIKSEGGMVMAQNPESTEYDGMPRSAIATGLVDYELPPSEMTDQLMAYVAQAFFGHSPRITPTPAPAAENALRKIFILLRARSGNDFSQYKTSAIYSRIAQRMARHKIETMNEYIRYLQQTPSEVDALFCDLLIGVTSFFRDPNAFDILEKQAIPKLFVGKRSDAAIRVWVPGCSTGEEAYSIAILIAEHQEAMKQSFMVQIFATDIDSRAITTARAGIYPVSIGANISRERLQRFFTAESDGGAYRIHKGIRDMLVFSEQNLIKNPPFSKIDLISCRNLLIYLNSELQKKLIPLFHYGLNPGGFLFLGTSETVGNSDDIFTVLDRKTKLYQRKEQFQGCHSTFAGRFVPPITAIEMALPRAARKTAFTVKQPLCELTERAILQQVAPAGALVNSKGDILYLHGRTGLYLEPAPGESGVNNILKMAREGLRRELTTSLSKAVRSAQIVRYPGLRVKTNGDITLVNLTIRPVATESVSLLESSVYLVILEEAPFLDNNQSQQFITGSDDPNSDIELHIAELKKELQAKGEYLQSSNEELETANEELKSSNEEMQSMNEEMQSTNEELETSKEELQSVNEELLTVNTELGIKVTDLSQANNDMNNLLAGTGIATVFVDYRLCILRFTPAANKIINLIISDIGRPISHIVSNLLGYNRLVADTQAVLNTLIPKEVEVQTVNENWYSLRINPYRTIDNVIEGAVITFVDITEMKQAKESLRKANELLRLAVVVRDAHDAITVQDLDGNVLAWNPGAVRMYGWSEAEALMMNIRDLVPEGLQEKALANIIRLGHAEILAPYRTQRITKAGAVVDVLVTATALVNETGRMYAVATTERTRKSRKARTKDLEVRIQ